MVVIADTAGQVFGCVVDVEWQESAKAFGGPGCRAFSLTPDFEVYKGDASFYYNTRGRAGEHGLGVYLRGKKRIWIDSDLKKGERSMGPGVKAVGVPEPVEVARLEVWGCGDPGCLEKQMATRKVSSAQSAGTYAPLPPHPRNTRVVIHLMFGPCRASGANTPPPNPLLHASLNTCARLLLCRR